MTIAPRQWLHVGDVTIGADGKTQFPELPPLRPECIIETTVRGTKRRKVPGIYRLTFDKDGRKYVWIGQTDDLQRCPFGDYCNPADGVERDNVVHDILVDAGGAKVEVIPQCDLLPKGTTRSTAEDEEQERAFEDQDVFLLNKLRRKKLRKRRCGPGYGYYLKVKAEYYKKTFEDTQRELGAWNANHPC